MLFLLILLGTSDHYIEVGVAGITFIVSVWFPVDGCFFKEPGIIEHIELQCATLILPPAAPAV
jgi:hypothetical protein